MISSNIPNGIKNIKEYSSIAPNSAGVYKMIGADGIILYIGKAKHLPTRLLQYTNLSGLSYRIKHMISMVDRVEFLTTENETAALILEANLVQSLKPKFNINLKDDKSFPYIAIDNSHIIPRVFKYRGKADSKLLLYGPFTSSSDLSLAISELQKIFLFRSCTDAYFKSRKKPCLLYQIKRCSAPCVQKVTKEEYKEQINALKKFFCGKVSQIQQDLIKKMEDASTEMMYEKAAEYRDKIKFLLNMQFLRPSIDQITDSDTIAFYIDPKSFNIAVQIFSIRNHYYSTTLTYFIENASEETLYNDILIFLINFYKEHQIPPVVITNIMDLIEFNPYSEESKPIEYMTENLSFFGISVRKPETEHEKVFMDFAKKNAKDMNNREKESLKHNIYLAEELKKYFSLRSDPILIEVYDNSHNQGSSAVGAMIRVKNFEFDKTSYRIFKIKSDIESRDDYGMLREVLTRRFEKNDIELPNLVIIDGGNGHLNIAKEVFTKLKLKNIDLISMAKGEERNSGREIFHGEFIEPLRLQRNSPISKFLIRIRDEVHRFGIKSHRKLYLKNFKSSKMDNIDSIGEKRKKLLLIHFGSFANLKLASLPDIEKVPGIGKKTAKIIFDFITKIQ